MEYKVGRCFRDLLLLFLLVIPAVSCIDHVSAFSNSIALTTGSEFSSLPLQNWTVGGRNFKSSYLSIVRNSSFPFQGNALRVCAGAGFNDKSYVLRNLAPIGPKLITVDVWFLIENRLNVKDIEFSEEMIYNGLFYPVSINWTPYWGTPRWRYWDAGNWHDIPGAKMDLVQNKWYHLVLVINYKSMTYESLTIDGQSLNVAAVSFHTTLDVRPQRLYPGLNLFGDGFGQATVLLGGFLVSSSDPP